MLKVHSTLPNSQNIENLSAKDYPEILSVWEASVRATHHFLSEKDIAFYKSLVLKYALPSMKAFGIRVQNKLAGYMAVSDYKVEMLFIAPEFIGQGLGKKLLSFALNELHIPLVDVNEENPNALGFYLHMGYQIISRDEKDGNGRPHPILHLRHKQHIEK